jgi:hypothetical protein
MQTMTYRLTVADLVDARGYAYNNLPLVRVIRLIPFIFTAGCLLLGACRAYQQDWSGVASLAGWFVLGLALIVWTYVGNRWLLPRSVRKQLSHSKGLQDDIVVSWDADRIMFETSRGQSRWSWSDFYRWQESAHGLLLWQSDRIYDYLPKRILTDDQVTGIRANLISAVGRPGKRRK